MEEKTHLSTSNISYLLISQWSYTKNTVNVFWSNVAEIKCNKHRRMNGSEEGMTGFVELKKVLLTGVVHV